MERMLEFWCEGLTDVYGRGSVEDPCWEDGTHCIDRGMRDQGRPLGSRTGNDRGVLPVC